MLSGRRCLLTAAIVVLGWSAASPPPATAASPWWRLGMTTRPSDLSTSAGEAELALTAINLGDAPAGGEAGPIVLLDTLPEGVAAVKASGVSGYPSTETTAVECSVLTSRTVSCTYDGPLTPYDQLEIRIVVELQPGGGWEGGTNRLEVTGGGAPPAVLERPLAPAAEPGALALEEFELRSEGEGGSLETQAGSHPFQVTAALSLTQTSEAFPTALPKDLRLRFPAGLAANLSSFSACPLKRFHESDCSPDTVLGVGTFSVNDPSKLGIATIVSPIFNLEAPPGEVARFGALPLDLPIIMRGSIRADDYSTELGIGNITQIAGFLGATVTLWGVPADPRHDDARGIDCLMAARGLSEYSCQRQESPDPQAMLTLPTSCDGPMLRSTAEVAPWADRLDPASAVDAFPPLTGCERLSFQPSADATLGGSSASSPAGLDLTLATPGEGLRSPDRLAEATVERIRTTLPEGFTINPSAAGGLSSCGRSAYDAATLDDGGCPDASKIGAVSIESPILSQPLSGSIYLGGEDGDVFDGTVPLYIVARLVKLQLVLRLDPRSGRVTVLAGELPPLPLSSLRLSFPQGPRALLATPPDCGTSAVEVGFVPSAEPAASAEVSSPLTIFSGPGGGACPGSRRPFHPSLVAGTAANAAGRYSPLYVRLSRADADSELAGFSLTLPPGLAVRLAGLPTASRVGRATVGVGVGSVLSYLPGALYKGGPYRGAPFSVTAVIPARLGPLDLGTVVRRFPVEIDPRTGRISLRFDADQRLPSILGGITLHLRDLRLYFDRESFAVNPTSCAPGAIDGTAYATDGAVAPLSERFQAAGCAKLPFKPSLSVRLSGGLGRNGHPALRATIRSRPREAHLAGADLTLPPGELLDLHRLRGLCARELPPQGCPPSSQIGQVRLRTPLLDQALRGPIYLRAPVRGLPLVVADLWAEGVHIVLQGHIAARAGRLRVSLDRLPDLPLAEATIVLAGGRRGILVNSEGLCGDREGPTAVVSAHNGRSRQVHPRILLHGRC
jgi:hypothetical protein